MHQLAPSDPEHWSIEKQPDYAYASHSNALPLTVAKFAVAMLEYSIVFLGNQDAPSPMVLLGVKPEENLYLEDGHRWKARYTSRPSFSRGGAKPCLMEQARAVRFSVA